MTFPPMRLTEQRPFSNSNISSRKFKIKILTSIGNLFEILNLFREQLKENASKDKFFIRVAMDDLINFDEKLAE